MHDTTQARDILKSSFTLAKSLHDIPTQVAVLSELRGEPFTSKQGYAVVDDASIFLFFIKL